MTDFWDRTYLPHIEKTAKASTNHGYKKIWDQHLLLEFSHFTLNEYKTHHATTFLTKLANERLGVRTIAHIKSLASGMFRFPVPGKASRSHTRIYARRS